MMLSNLMTANKRDAKPAIQQTSNTENMIKLEIPTKLFVGAFLFLTGVSLILPILLSTILRNELLIDDINDFKLPLK